MIAPPLIRREDHGPVALLRLDNPATRNALTWENQAELVSSLEAVGREAGVRVVVITGGEDHFSVGADLVYFDRLRREHDQSGEPLPRFSNGVARAMLALEAPIIAAVNGPAVGGGLTLSLLCDLRLAGEGARFGTAFVAAGIVPEYGSSFLLSRVVGHGRAADLVLTGRIVEAPEALAMGLVSRVLPRGEVLPAALDLARQMAARPPRALREAKAILRRGLEGSLDQALAREELVNDRLMRSQDQAEAMAAFLAKREPDFSGD